MGRWTYKVWCDGEWKGRGEVEMQMSVICRMSFVAGGLSMNLPVGGAIDGGKVRKLETQEAISTRLDVLNGR